MGVGILNDIHYNVLLLHVVYICDMAWYRFRINKQHLLFTSWCPWASFKVPNPLSFFWTRDGDAFPMRLIQSPKQSYILSQFRDGGPRTELAMSPCYSQARFFLVLEGCYLIRAHTHSQWTPLCVPLRSGSTGRYTHFSCVGYGVCLFNYQGCFVVRYPGAAMRSVCPPSPLTPSGPIRTGGSECVRGAGGRPQRIGATHPAARGTSTLTSRRAGFGFSIPAGQRGHAGIRCGRYPSPTLEPLPAYAVPAWRWCSRACTWSGRVYLYGPSRHSLGAKNQMMTYLTLAYAHTLLGNM